MKRFEDKVGLITGAAAGIGRATAQRLASEGASLLLLDVQAEAVAETAELCGGGGGKVLHRTCDVSDPGQVAGAVQHCVDELCKLDVLINIAGILSLDHTHELSLERWDQVLAINLTGTFLFCQAALPHLLASKGSIVNTSSTSAIAGMPYGAAYGASKAGVMALTRTLAVEYGKKGLRANAVSPGSIKTAMTTRQALPENLDFKLIERHMPLDIPRGPETVANVIAMLASDEGVHINGESIRVDGGTLA